MTPTFMTCPDCGLRVYIGAFWRPVSCTERDADDYGRECSSSSGEIGSSTAASSQRSKP